MTNNDFLNIIGFQKHPLTHLNQLEIHLADHCNLNCRSCDHYSPVSKENFPDYKAIKKDMKHLSEITNANIDNILLLGGEPLLNPNIVNYIILMRNFFPKTQITIVTNGILLNKQSDDFYKSCINNDILIEITKYPICFDYEKIEQFLQFKGVKYAFVGSTKTKEKTTHRLVLDELGKQDPIYSFNHCFHSTKCYQYYNGKIFMCPCCAYVHKLNEFFSKNFIIQKEDFLEVKKIKNIQEILQYLSNPIPFCRYCDVDKRSFKNKWSTSLKDKGEWLN